MYVINGTFYYSQTKVINPVKGDQLKSELPGSMIIKDYYSSTYLDPNEQKVTLSLLVNNA